MIATGWSLLCAALLIALFATVAGVYFNGQIGLLEAIDALFTEMSIVFLVAIMIGIPMGIGRWLAEHVDESKASSPKSVLRSDRTALLAAALLSGAIPAIGMGFFLFFTAADNSNESWSLDPDPGPGPGPGPEIIVAFSALFGLAIMTVIIAGSGSAWLAYSVARLWLAFRGRLPWRPMSFLNTAYRKGALRETGHSYQLRHELLRTHLAGKWISEHGSTTARRPLPGLPRILHRLRDMRHRRWHGLATLAATLVLFLGTTWVLQINHQVSFLGTGVRAVEFSSDGHTVTIATDSQIRLWDIQNKKTKDVFNTHSEYDTNITLSHDGTDRKSVV